MRNGILQACGPVVTMTGAILLAAAAGCSSDDPGRRAGIHSRSATRMQADLAIQDDYDYYPAYETYYSRNRHEFVYRDGNVWVRRPAPRGVSLRVLLASPVVRMDFRDSPDQHHNSVVRRYPKNWTADEIKRADTDVYRDNVDESPSHDNSGTGNRR